MVFSKAFSRRYAAVTGLVFEMPDNRLSRPPELESSNPGGFEQ
jgi:hypothetical protein